VRQALDLRIGDEIAYLIAKGRVVITPARPATNADLFAVFHEWAGDADDKVYAEL
jgi:antitoxin PrlF